MDLEILAALSNRDAWEKYHRFVRLSSLTEESANIFQAMGDWYANNPKVANVSWKPFASWFALVRHAKMDPEKLRLHKLLLNKLETEKFVEDDIRPLLEGLTRRDFASQIADVALRIADGDTKAQFVEIESLLEKYEKTTDRVSSMEKHLGDFSLDALASVSGPGLEWRLDPLNEGAGDLRQGDLVLIGKRPDAGGTTFLSAEASYMAPQLPPDKCVLWVNNEEQGDKVRRRIVQSAVGCTTDEMDEHLGEILEEYEALMGGDRRKIEVYDKAKVHVKDVEQAIKRLNPGLIVFDQLWKFKGFENLGEVERQTELANWAREIAKEHAPVIAVHQLGGDAEGKPYPSMDMLYGSKTGIQGEADLIIMLGRKDNSSTRYISLPKNKLQTPRNRAKRNGRWTVTLDADIARFA